MPRPRSSYELTEDLASLRRLTASKALTSSYASVVLADGEGGELPDEADGEVPYGHSVQGRATAVSGAASITFYLSSDAAGDVPLTDETTKALVGQSSGTKGFMAGWATPSPLPSGGAVYLWAKTDAGTVTLGFDLYWSRASAPVSEVSS